MTDKERTSGDWELKVSIDIRTGDFRIRGDRGSHFARTVW